MPHRVRTLTWRKRLSVFQQGPSDSSGGKLTVVQDDGCLPIPPEITSRILQYLSIPKDNGAPVLYDPRTVEIQRMLYYICIVCRLWNEISTRLLYTHPIITSARALELLRRTLECSPQIALQVQGMTFYSDQRLKVHYAELGSHLNIWNASFVAFSHLCSSLRTFSIRLRHSRDFMNIQKLPVDRRIPFHLEFMLARRSTLEAMLTLFSFPILERLCVYSYPWTPLTRSPPLPCVHTLQLYKCINSVSDIGEVARWQKVLPSLRALEILGDDSPTHAAIAVVPIQRLPNIPDLERFVFVQVPSIRNFDVWANCSSRVSLRYLTFGVVSHADHFLSRWELPPFLETLTFFVTVKKPIRSTKDKGFSWMFIVRCLEYNRNLLKTRLNRLVINSCENVKAIGSPWKERVHKHVVRTKEICNELGVSFELNHIGEFSLRLVP